MPRASSPAQPFWITAFAVAALGCIQIKASTTYVGTVSNSAAWTITYDGPSGNVSGIAMNYNNGGSNISLSSDGKEDGTFSGAEGSLTSADLAASFNGVWDADLDFVLPADAFNVVLTFANLAVDDRVILELNGDTHWKRWASGAQRTLTGVMSFDLDSPLVTTVQDFDADTSGTVSTGFIVGGTNDLRLVVNNTNAAPNFTNGSNLAAASQGFQSSGDSTLVGLNATLTFDTTPEPTTFLLVSSALAGLLVRLRRPQIRQ